MSYLRTGVLLRHSDLQDDLLVNLGCRVQIDELPQVAVDLPFVEYRDSCEVVSSTIY